MTMKPDEGDLETPRIEHKFVDLDRSSKKRHKRRPPKKLKSAKKNNSDNKKRYSEGANFYHTCRGRSMQVDIGFKNFDKDAFFSDEINVEMGEQRFDRFFDRVDDGIRAAMLRQKGYKELFDK